MRIRILTLVAVAFAGCISAPPERVPDVAPASAEAAAVARPVFPELLPIVPARADALAAMEATGRPPDSAGPGAAVRTAEAAPREARLPAAEGSVVKVVPQVDSQVETAMAPVARRDGRANLQEALADVARKLEAFEERVPEDLDTFSRLKLMKLETEALLLLLLTNETEREECARIVKILKKFPVASLEVAGLQFVLYQRLAEYSRRDEMLEYLLREARGRSLFRLEGVVFCEKVTGYGKVVPVARAAFKSGQRVTIYSGFRGAQIRGAEGGGREQHVQAYLSILDNQGKVIDTVQFTGANEGLRRVEGDASSERPSYLFGEYTLPASLSPGTYQLKLSATDLVGRAESSAVTSFDVSR